MLILLIVLPACVLFFKKVVAGFSYCPATTWDEWAPSLLYVQSRDWRSAKYGTLGNKPQNHAYHTDEILIIQELAS